MNQPGVNRKRSFFQRLRTPYRLIILNNDTLEEQTSLRLSLLNLYMLICAIGIISALIVLALIVFTPLKTYVPGYADYSQTREFLEMTRQVNSLEEQLNAQILYTESLSRILMGDFETADDVARAFRSSEDVENGEGNGEVSIPQRIPEDEILRREVDLRAVMTNEGFPNTADYRSLRFYPPLTGFVSFSFDRSINHLGVDVIAPKDSPVKAIMDGIVFLNDWTLQTGHTLGIMHDGNIMSFYKHNAYNTKGVGDRVQAGETIAIIGNTGSQTDGPHLHFELWIDGVPVNPEDYIQFSN